MTVTWRLRQTAAPLLHCPFEYDNPVPEPECVCEGMYEEHDCPCCAPECECERRDWRPVIRCHRRNQVRVQLADGRYTECCSPEAHGLPVQWWSPVYGPDFIPRRSPGAALSLETVDRLYKYMYRDSSIETLVQAPLWLPSSDVSFRYGVVEIDLASDDDED